MRAFNPLLFRLYASDLEQAILGLSRERMGVHETRQALGMPELTMSYSDGETEVWTNGDASAQLQSGASIHQIGEALNATSLPRVALGPAPAFTSSESPTTPLPAVEIIPPQVPAKIVDDAPLSNVTGLQFGAFQDALAQIRKRIGDKQQQAVNKIVGAVAAGEAKIEAAAHEVSTKIDKEISAALQEFAQSTNGGPQ